MDNKQAKPRILMLPWLAHGHMSPFLELAKQLSVRNFYVYFCSTPIILASIREKQLNSIELIELNLPSTPDLPPHLHTSKGLPPHLKLTLQTHFLNSAPQCFSIIINNLRPDLIIYDMFSHCVPTLASRLNIPAVYFPPVSATVISLTVHEKRKRRGIEFPFPNMTSFLRDDESADADAAALFTPETVLSWSDMSSNIILFNSCKVVEEKYMDYVSVSTKKKVIPVGPLIHVPDPNINIEGGGDAGDMKIIEWLAKKDRFSCIFVSFGSEYYLSKVQLEELAYGLELSNVNFIWVVRFPLGGEKTMTVEEALPDGFIQRMGERGMVIDGWAPQTKILGHENVGGYVCHCGWGSTIESLYFGVPIIAMPMQYDNPMHSRLVEEVGVGVEVMRNEDGNYYKREEITKVIKQVVVEKSGEEIRRKANEVSEKMRAEADLAADNVAEELTKLCKMNMAG